MLANDKEILIIKTMFVSLRPMPIPECRPIYPAQAQHISRKMILPAIPTDLEPPRQHTHDPERFSVPQLQSAPRSNTPQALEAEIVRLGNQRKVPELVTSPPTPVSRPPQAEKITPTGYRPLHMLYQASTHSVIDGHGFQKSRGFSFYFSWHDILLFCLVGLVAAVITGSLLLISL